MAGIASFIRVALDGVGKKMQTWANTIDGDEVHTEAVVLVSKNGDPLATDEAENYLQVSALGSEGNPLQTTNGGVLLARLQGGVATINGQIADGADVTQGTIADAAVDTDADGTVNAHLRGLVKSTGAQADSSASSDTGTFSQISLFKRLLEKVTALTSLFPTSLGGKTAAASFSVTTATDDPELTLIGSVTETAPATDTASSGLNGRLQRIAQRITTLLGIYDSTNTLLPTSGKKLAVATYSPTLFQNLGADVTKNVKASAGNVFSIICYNANAAARYLQLHNTATTPASSAVPILSFLVPPSGQIGIGSDIFTNEGINFATGIAFAFSTARNIYTAGSAGDQSTFIQYK